MPLPTLQKSPFTKSAIENIEAGQMGIYAIFKGGDCVYIGRGDIRARLLSHVNGDNPCIASRRPDTWGAFIVDNEITREQRERSLIREYGPPCNQRVG